MKTWLFTKARVKRQWWDKRLGKDWQSGRLLEMGTEARLAVVPAQMVNQTCLAIELETSWWCGSAHWLSSTGQTGLPRSIPLGLTCPQIIVCSGVMYWWKEMVRNGATRSLQLCHRNTCRITALPWFEAFGWTSEHLLLAQPLFSEVV